MNLVAYSQNEYGKSGFGEIGSAFWNWNVEVRIFVTKTPQRRIGNLMRRLSMASVITL